MENLSYSKAMKEIEEILKYIESQEVDVDVLVEKVKRATELIRFCKSKLKSAEEELHKTLISLEEQNSTDIEPF
ncbi:exodeoxyribonuclease VII small subunit [Thermodesulfovibrio aggregans]|uniref:Exodeoxyribonuclease VII small subunit n=1 Tax=Thermodesulfovibrio aggregans TaxID=86166 RepID=A0A0U9HR46_9BACT|nr:exodeoxyribonuclease VII small subunit [Thermodesulfovibrio aggregans]GAQ95284.1 exodeoxyribonuclease VII small subunit [Thermodesulfovibrio aggregans]